MDTPLFD